MATYGKKRRGINTETKTKKGVPNVFGRRAVFPDKKKVAVKKKVAKAAPPPPKKKSTPRTKVTRPSSRVSELLTEMDELIGLDEAKTRLRKARNQLHYSPPSRGQAMEQAGKKRKSPEKKSLGLRDFGRKLIGKKKAKTKAGRAAQGALGTALGAAYGLRGGASGIIAGKLAEAIAKAPRTRGGIGPRPDRNAPRKPRPLIKPRKGPLGSITGIMPKKKSRTLVTSRRPPKR